MACSKPSRLAKLSATMNCLESLIATFADTLLSRSAHRSLSLRFELGVSRYGCSVPSVLWRCGRPDMEKACLGTTNQIVVLSFRVPCRMWDVVGLRCLLPEIGQNRSNPFVIANGDMKNDYTYCRVVAESTISD